MGSVLVSCSWEEKSSLLPKSRRNGMPSQFFQWLTKTRFFQWLTKTSNTPQELSLLFMRMRKCVGVIGVALPPVLIIGLILVEGQSKLLDSISVYYYSDYTDYRVIGNIFDGSMFATGIFLICYQYQLLDDIVSTIAGVCAIGVALFPTTPYCPPNNMKCVIPPLQMTIGNWHTVFAISFLLLLTVFSLWLFRKSDKKDPKDRTTEKGKRNKFYYVCGFAMLIILGLAGLDLFVPYLHNASWLQRYQPNTWFEVVTVEAFGIAWFIKGGTFGILKDKVTPTPVGVQQDKVTPTPEGVQQDKVTPTPKGVQNRAIRIVALTLGVLAGVLGVIHGASEILRGNGDPGGIYISAMGSPCQANSAWHLCFPAITIIPNHYWVTGVFAISVSVIVCIWTIAFVQWEYGGLVLMLLSIIQLLVGGGYISPVLCFIAGMVGTGIQATFTWYPSFLRRPFLATVWLWPLFLILFVLLFPATLLLGSFANEFLLSLARLPIFFILGLLLLFLALAILAGFAYDTQRQDSQQQAPSVSG